MQPTGRRAGSGLCSSCTLQNRHALGVRATSVIGRRNACLVDCGRSPALCEVASTASSSSRAEALLELFPSLFELLLEIARRGAVAGQGCPASLEFAVGRVTLGDPLGELAAGLLELILQHRRALSSARAVVEKSGSGRIGRVEEAAALGS